MDEMEIQKIVGLTSDMTLKLVAIESAVSKMRRALMRGNLPEVWSAVGFLKRQAVDPAWKQMDDFYGNPQPLPEEGKEGA